MQESCRPFGFGRSYRVPELAVEEYLVAEQHKAETNPRLATT